MADERVPVFCANLAKEAPRNISFQQAITISGEGRVIPYTAIDREINEPAEQQVVVDLFHQMAFAHEVMDSGQSLSASSGTASKRSATRP